jgi:glycine hydroxymethyltransferase
MTSRGFVESDFEQVADFIDRAIELGVEIQKQSGPKLSDFNSWIEENNPGPLEELKNDVEALASGFEGIGVCV